MNAKFQINAMYLSSVDRGATMEGPAFKYSREARMALHVKRVYDAPEAADGIRILVDRIWPRGLSKEDARLDHWMKDVAPSSDLRKWFGHDPERWAQFRQRYFAELDAADGPVGTLRKETDGKTATLLYAARDQEHNNAVALRDYLQGERS